MNKDIFLIEVKKLGIEINSDMMEKLDIFYKLLVEWNKKINLTTIVDEKEVYLKHFYDSLTLVKEIDLKKDFYLCDVGSGAGFPGIVLKIVFPNLKIVLIDSLQKRVNYLNEIIKELELDNIQAEHYRMEDYSRLNEEKFDVITARAVANLGILTEISVKALKINGNLVFMKANCDEEIENVSRKMDKLGVTIESINRFKLPIEDSNRTLINIKKIKKTATKYPRNINEIKKEYL